MVDTDRGCEGAMERTQRSRVVGSGPMCVGWGRVQEVRCFYQSGGNRTVSEEVYAVYTCLGRSIRLGYRKEKKIFISFRQRPTSIPFSDRSLFSLNVLPGSIPTSDEDDIILISPFASVWTLSY